MTTQNDSIRVFNQEGCDFISISKEQQISIEQHHESMVKMQTSDKAKHWFHRKPYAAFDLRKGDSIEQTETESIPGTAPGDSEVGT